MKCAIYRCVERVSQRALKCARYRAILLLVCTAVVLCAGSLIAECLARLEVHAKVGRVTVDGFVAVMPLGDPEQRALFVGFDSEHGSELWETDGTREGEVPNSAALCWGMDRRTLPCSFTIKRLQSPTPMAIHCCSSIRIVKNVARAPCCAFSTNNQPRSSRRSHGTASYHFCCKSATSGPKRRDGNRASSILDVLLLDGVNDSARISAHSRE